MEHSIATSNTCPLHDYSTLTIMAWYTALDLLTTLFIQSKVLTPKI
ncbi:hypothetical protein ABIE66_003093 [Peribacillus sp. B2I2]